MWILARERATRVRWCLSSSTFADHALNVRFIARFLIFFAARSRRTRSRRASSIELRQPSNALAAALRSTRRKIRFAVRLRRSPSLIWYCQASQPIASTLLSILERTRRSSSRWRLASSATPCHSCMHLTAQRCCIRASDLRTLVRLTTRSCTLSRQPSKANDCVRRYMRCANRSRAQTCLFFIMVW